MRAPINSDLLANLPTIPPGSKSLRINDTKIIGLNLEVGVRGFTYYVRVRDNRGRCRNMKIGKGQEITLSQATKKAQEWQAQAKLGLDPAAEQNRLKKIPTLKTFIEERYMPFIKDEMRSHLNVVSYTRRIIARFGRLALDELQVDQVQAFKTALLKEGLANSTVNSHLATLRRIYNLAGQWRVWSGPNPAANPKMLRVPNRDMYLADAETSTLLSVLRSMPDNHAMQAILILALTGARRDEILHARWKDLNLDRGVLTVPLSKSGKPRHIFLIPAAVDILAARRQSHGDHPYIFPGRVPDEPLKDIKRAWKNVKDMAALPPGFRLHDLRHNFASALVNKGATLAEVGALLGHSNPHVTMRYAHHAPQRLIKTANTVSTGWHLGDNPSPN